MTDLSVDRRPSPRLEAVAARVTPALALLIAVFGLALRLVHSAANSLSLDETSSLWLARQSLGDIFRLVVVERLDATPPLYYFLLHPVVSLASTPLALRLVSIVAGVVMVWLTFYLALELFDRRVATLSALLMAIAPVPIIYSQVARSYMLAAVFALLALLLLARLLFGRPSAGAQVGLVATLAAALGTHYLTFSLALFVALPMLYLVTRGRLGRPRPTVQLAALVVVALVGALAVSSGQHYFGSQTWVPRPGPQAIIKSLILFGTGDPSYGPIGLTPLRVASLGALSLVGVLGALEWARRSRGAEAARVALLVGAVVVPWLVMFTVSQVYSVYREKYMLFLAPPLLILVAWSLTRLRYRPVAVALLVVLVGLNVRSLQVYYTEPYGEQWREAMATIAAQARPGDALLTSPGFYSRPMAYYWWGDFPTNLADLTYAPAAVFDTDTLRAWRPYDTSADTAFVEAALSGRRIWWVTGGMAAHSDVESWIAENHHVVQQIDFLGLSVRLLE